MPAGAYAIWHAADAAEAVRFAAAELAAYLGRMTALELAVRPAESDGCPPLELRLTAEDAPSRSQALAGELASRMRPVPPPHAVVPGADGFLWRAADGALSIAGVRPRSVLYGVYDLLEELSCRFFGASPEDEVVPAIGADALARFLAAPRERFEQPTFAYRERHFLDMIDHETTRREVDHLAKRRMNAMTFWIDEFVLDADVWAGIKREIFPELRRRDLVPGIAEHGLYQLLMPGQRYAAEHPDWFALVNGQRVGGIRVGGRRYQFCTENPAAMATFLENLETFLRQNTELRILYTAPEDASPWCECDRCAGISIADRYLRVENAIAERAAAVIPDVRVTHLLYATHAELPDRERPSPRLDCSFLPFARDYGYPFADPRTNQHVDLHPWRQDLPPRWAELCRASGAGFLKTTKMMRFRWVTFRFLPLPHAQTDMRYWRDLGVGGFDCQQEQEGWWVKHLNGYALARLLWNLDQPIEEILADYYAHYWREVGDEARAIFEATARALPNLRYSRHQPAFLIGLRPGRPAPPPEQAREEEAYLVRAIDDLRAVSQRVGALQQRGGVDPSVGQRLLKLGDAVDGAVGALAVSLAVRRYWLARGTPDQAAALAAARAAHDSYVGLQTPERIRAGTLYTGRWRRDELFDAWEQEAASRRPSPTT